MAIWPEILADTLALCHSDSQEPWGVAAQFSQKTSRSCQTKPIKAQMYVVKNDLR